MNIIANAVFNEYYKVKLISCYFLINTTEVDQKEIDTSDESDNDALFKGGIRENKKSKNTKSKENKLIRDKKKAKKKMLKRLKKQA